MRSFVASVVRLKLPPGMSVMEFAASDVMKNITSKLSGLVNTPNTNKSESIFRFIISLIENYYMSVC